MFIWLMDWLIDWSIEYLMIYALLEKISFVYEATVPVKVYTRRLRSLDRQGSLSCYTCYDTGLRSTGSHPKVDRPV